MFPQCTCVVILFLFFRGLDARLFDCDDPSVVIECMYDPDSGQSCGLRLEQSLRLYNVVDTEVKKIHGWLDETVIREEIDAVKDLRRYLNQILSTDDVTYDSVAYVLYICRFRPFSCARGSRYRRGSRMSDTNGTAISKMQAAQEAMRARWASICHRMVWLERQSLPKHVFWRNESTGTFYCTLHSVVPWKYAMEISSHGFTPVSESAKYEKNLTICRASISHRYSNDAVAVRCVVRFRTGIVRTIYLWEYNHFFQGHENPPYLFKVVLVLCIVPYLVFLFHKLCVRSQY